MDRIGRYEIIEELGRGAMGAVYKARDPRIGRIVAIKIILTSGLNANELADYRRRFAREAQTAGQLSHSGIVTIYDIAEDEKGQPYLVMEFIDGVTLQRILRPALGGNQHDRLPLERALDLAAQVAETLDCAHKHGVVHSDIKPGNILVTPAGHIKIADFGIARFTNAEATKTAAVAGTPAYMAPEQLRDGDVDARSDIFSLGAMIYWMITGYKPFPGEDMASVSFKVVYTDPPKPSVVDRDLPRDLDIMISRCLAKNPADRYATAKDLAADLQCIRRRQPITTTAAPPATRHEPTETLQMATGPFATQVPELPASRPLNRGLVTAAITVLTLAVIMILLRPAERPIIITSPAQVDTNPQVVSANDNVVVPPEVKPVVSTPKPAIETSVVRSAVNPAPAPPVEPVKPPVEPVKPPVEPVSPPAAIAKNAPAASSTLYFECRHSFRNATLQIFSDGKEVEFAVLEKKGRWFVSSGNKVANQLSLSPGLHKLRVRVRSNDEKNLFDQESSIQGDFPKNGSLHLRIEFPKDQLWLHWTSD